MDDPKGNKDSSTWLGHREESRRSYRRQTLATIAFQEAPGRDAHATVSNLSSEGAFLHTVDRPAVGTRLVFDMQLPTGGKRPLRVVGRIVRSDDEGLGVRFEDLLSRNRSRIRDYARFVEMDDAVVTLQGAMKGVLSGNLLPVSEWMLIEERLRAAVDRELEVLVVHPDKKREPIKARIDYAENNLLLRDIEQPLPQDTQVVYVMILDGPLHAVFEGLLVETETACRLLPPQRMYHNERRWSRRTSVKDTWMVLDAPHLGEGAIQLPVKNVSEGGCAVRIHKTSPIAVGIRFPAFQLRDGEKAAPHPGGTITRIVPHDQNDDWLVGLNFLDSAADRDAFAEIQDRSVRSSAWSNFIRLSGMARHKLRNLIVRKQKPVHGQVVVARYKNARRETVASILDATFDLNEDPPPVDVVVVIGQPFQVRKEVFNLLARTLVDNFKNAGIQGVVLRFDLTHTVGESEVDPELDAKGCPYLRWTYSHYEDDLLGSLAYLERRFRPRKRVLVTYSVAAIPARRMIADGREPNVDLWIAPFGCPDGQDMFKNLLAGVDLFQKYLRGKKAEPFLIYGRLADPNGVMPDAMKRGMAFLEDARRDMEKITIPVTWILGTYDYMVTRARVRQLLNAPGSGPREIIELTSGHFLKTGPEAIESYKLISETISKQLFHSDRSAVDPDLSRFARQNEAEWARCKRAKIPNTTEFWDRHLFGTCGEREGYDILLHNPDYVDFLARQARLIDVRPGQRVADVGCGTGNLAAAILEARAPDGMPLDLTCVDLVPGAVERTRKKIEEMIQRVPDGAPDGVRLDCRIADLEAQRLSPLRDFLAGKLYGPSALAGRVEGLSALALRKVSESYGQKMHRILGGQRSTPEEVQTLCPDLDDAEADMMLELSRASRFLRDQLLPEDLLPGLRAAESTRDLSFSHLDFGRSTRNCRIDLPSGAFDRIGASLVLPYLFDPPSVLEELHRSLASGGVIVLSSLKPNFDSSKSYIEQAEAMAGRKDLDGEERERLLASLREFSAFLGRVIELEDEGRFRFFSAEELTGLMEEAGFSDVSTYDALGSPPTAVIVVANKK